MKREFLKELGLDDDAVEKVIAEHGKTLNKTKEDLTSIEEERNNLKQELKDRDSQLEELSGQVKDNEQLSNQIELLKEQNKTKAEALQAKIDQQTFDFALERALMSAKARNPKAVKALLDTDIIKVEEDKVVGLDEQLQALQESDSYLFDVQTETKKSPKYTPGSSKKHNRDPYRSDDYDYGVAAYDNLVKKGKIKTRNEEEK